MDTGLADLRTLVLVHRQGIIFAMAFAKGIPLDSAAILSTVLEGILYGECLNEFVCPIPIKIARFRFLCTDVYWHHLGTDIQASHAGRQSSNHCCGRPAVGTEHRG